MEKLIACCGIDCSQCDARTATINNDDELREKTARLWRVQHNAAGLTAGMINCTGCTETGVKFSHCENCEIRKCALSKGFKTCGECDLLETCNTIKPLLQFVPDALKNLKSLN